MARYNPPLPEKKDSIRDRVEKALHYTKWKKPVNQMGEVMQILFFARLKTFNHGVQTVAWYQNAVVFIENAPVVAKKHALEAAKKDILDSITGNIESHTWVEQKQRTKWQRFLARLFTYYYLKYPLTVTHYFNEWEPLNYPSSYDKGM